MVSSSAKSNDFSSTVIEQMAWERVNRHDKCDQVSICVQISKNHCYNCCIAPSSLRHLAALHFAVVCWAFGAIHGASERWCLRSNRKARDVRRLPGRVNHPNLAARNQLRASERLARARLCFELSSSRPGNGSLQFRETRSPKQIAHTGNTSVFEPCVLCVLCVVQMIQDTACLSRRVPTCS